VHLIKKKIKLGFVKLKGITVVSNILYSLKT